MERKRHPGHLLFEKTVPEGTIQVEDKIIYGRRARFLLVDGYMESAVFTEPGYRNELIFTYMKSFDAALRTREPFQSVLLIGGGAMAYPRHLLNCYSDICMDAAEYSPNILSISRDWFGLKELQNEFRERFPVIPDDGFKYLARSHIRYDVIINDAYARNRLAGKSAAHCKTVYQKLMPGGLYIINAVSAMKGPKSLTGRRIIRNLGKLFRYTTQLPVDPDRSAWENQNTLIIASDKPI